MSLLSNPFLEMALWASILVSIASGTIGSFVVIKRISFIAGAISHSLLGGMGLSIWLNRSYGLTWLDPLFGAFAGAIISALLLGSVHLNYRQREDAVIAAIWSTGMAIGVIFISLTPGTNVDMMNFLFGNILWIHTRDLILLGALDVLIIAILIFYYRRFLLLSFDEEQALLKGIPVKRLYMLLLSLVAVTVVLLIQVIGIVLVIALLTIPPTIAGLFTNRLPVMIGIAVALSALFSLFGLEASYRLDWPPGSTIALLAALVYFAILLLKPWFKNLVTVRIKAIDRAP
jgi:zinc transport system permease protein